MFLEKGFARTTIESVAASIGMTKRTLYSRFVDKQALFIAAVERAIERSVTPEEQLQALDHDDLATTLAAVARLRIARTSTPEGIRLQRIINTESYRFPEIFMMHYERSSKPVIDFLAEILSRYRNAGVLEIERPDMAANIFMSMVVGGPVRSIVSGIRLTRAEIDVRVDFGVRLFLDGARKR